MSELKCPICGKKLWYDEQDSIYRCMKSTCVMDYEGGTEQLWQELIRTRKALDVAVDALKEFDRNNIDYGPAFEALYIIKQITENKRKDNDIRQFNRNPRNAVARYKH